MQYWKVVILCGLTVGTSGTWCRPQVDKQFNPRVNVTGTRIHVKISVTVVPADVHHLAVLPVGFGEPGELALCDCEFATGPPDGLSCDKEGWFISNFERQGSWVSHVTVPCYQSACTDTRGVLPLHFALSLSIL